MRAPAAWFSVLWILAAAAAEWHRDAAPAANAHVLQQEAAAERLAADPSPEKAGRLVQLLWPRK